MTDGIAPRRAAGSAACSSTPRRCGSTATSGSCGSGRGSARSAGRSRWSRSRTRCTSSPATSSPSAPSRSSSSSPTLIFALGGGAVADAVDRRRLLLLTQLGQAGCSLAFLAIALTAAPSLLAIYVVMFVSTALGAIDGPARAAADPPPRPRRAPPGRHRAQPADLQRRLGHRARDRRHRHRGVRRRRRLRDRRRDVRVGDRGAPADVAHPAGARRAPARASRRHGGAALRAPAP